MRTPDADDLYALLGVDAEADDAQVRGAWRRLALQWHPDHAGPAATATFQRISAAYQVLSDPEARVAYDKWRAAGVPRMSVATSIGRRAPSVMLRRVSGPYNALLARGIARPAEGDIVELFLQPDEVAEGGMVTIAMRVPVRTGGDDLFSAWLAVRPGVAEGTILTPSAWLPEMVRPVYFRVRIA